MPEENIFRKAASIMKPSMPQRRTTVGGLQNSRNLRHEMTDAELVLWRALRSNQMENVHFRRQHAVGPFVVDFCAPRRKLVIEVDGGQHAVQGEYDRKRSEYLRSRGYSVLRFWNHEVLSNLDGVVAVILAALGVGEGGEG